MPSAGDRAGDARVVERHDRVHVEGDIAQPCAILALAQRLDHLLVSANRVVVVPPLAEHQGVADEHVARDAGVDAVVGNAAPVDDGDAVQRDPLGAHRSARALRPQRLGVRPGHEVAGEWLDPGRVDASDHATPQARRLHQFGGHDPLGQARGLGPVCLVPPRRSGRSGEGGSGPHGEPRAARPEVLPPAPPCRCPGGCLRRRVAVARLEAADVRQQTGEDRAVHGVGVPRRCRVRRGVPLRGLDGLAHLLDEVLPLAHAQVVEELVTAQAAERRR